jgi:hypothetical protein
MTAMHDDLDQRLLDLLDHPASDPDAPRNPVLTHQVMERVRQAHTTARMAKPDLWLWLVGAVVVAPRAMSATTTGVVGDGGLGEAAAWFDEELVLELVIGALIGATALALTWWRPA